MAINLKKYETELKNAWQDVVDDKTDTNWALFGYDKQSNDLKLVSTGKNGLEELVDRLNVSKIMYAFARVIDTKTELPKYVLVNWQGEGAPFSRKGMCANHIHDVSKFFRGAHVTINARCEDEVEPSSIMQVVSRASTTKYSFKERSEPVENTGPVGTNYKRAQPQREINLNERENFWTKQQEEEKRRKLEEKKKLEEAKVKMEEEQRKREEKDAKEREDLVQQKEVEIQKRREAEKNAENVARNELSRRLSVGSEENDEEDDRIKRRNQLTKERNEETQRLLSQRSVKNARAIFERNSSAGQLSTVKMADKESTGIDQRSDEVGPAKTLEEPQKAEEAAQPIVAEPQESQVEVVNEKTTNIHESVQSLPKESELLAENEQLEQEEEEEEEEEEGEEEEIEAEEYEEIYDIRQINQTVEAMHYGVKCPYSEPLEDIEEEAEDASDDQPASGEGNITKPPCPDLEEGLKAKALYDYQAADETEISFDPDDIITHIEQIDEGWWQGMGPDGTYGLFPANYVELLD